MSKSTIGTDTYYAVEWRSKKAPHKGWHLVRDKYGNTKRHDTAEEAKAVINEKQAILSLFGFGSMNEIRIVKITTTKEVVE